MKKIIILALFILFSINQAKITAKDNNKFLGYTAKINLQVINVEKVQEEIIQFLEKNDLGFFTNRDNNFIQVKLLQKENNDKILRNVFIGFIKERGMLISDEIDSKNYQQLIGDLDVSVKTYEESLTRILQIFDKAGLYETLDAEKRIQDLILQVENAKGQLRFIREHIKYAYVDITFKTYTSMVKTSVQSPFEWINSLRLENLFREY